MFPVMAWIKDSRMQVVSFFRLYFLVEVGFVGEKDSGLAIEQSHLDHHPFSRS